METYSRGGISRLGLVLQRELLDEKTFMYVVEWCETPDTRQAGVTYTDTSVLYDVAGRAVSVAAASPDNNIFLRVPHPLLDPVLQVTEERLQMFYRQSFWCNIKVFRCFHAAQALAKRGENIDRCFIGISPGSHIRNRVLWDGGLSVLNRYRHLGTHSNVFRVET